MKFLTRIIQLSMIAVPVWILVWLLGQWTVPTGFFHVTHIVGESSPFIDEIKPETRVLAVEKTSSGDAQQAIVEDPAFFFVHPHRDFFDEIVLDVWFKNEDLPIVELGGLAVANPETYTILPLQNRLIDESPWSRLDQDGLVLLQKTPRYSSLDAFFADPPSRDQVAVYRTSFDSPYRIEGYQPSSNKQSIDVSLRGHHEFKTYIRDEQLSFQFSYMDMNRDEGKDIVQITVFNEAGQPVAETRANDDGNIADDSLVIGGLRHLNLTASGLAEGVYKVVVNADRDIFFRNIVTPQQKIVFLNTIFIGDEIGYSDPGRNATFYTKAKRLRLQTRHAEGVQTVSTNDQTIDIEEPYVWYPLSLSGEKLEVIHLPQGDVEVVTEGTFSFSREQYFNPDPASLNAYTTIDQLGVGYVLAQYVSPRSVGDWFVARVSFETAKLFEKEATWKFSFSTPLIQELSAKLFIHQIEATFNRNE